MGDICCREWNVVQDIQGRDRCFYTEKEGMIMDWFTADWHLFHEKMIALAHRPFSNATEMEETLISNYNSVVAKGDRVFFVGDMALNYHKDTQERMEATLSRLTGQKFLVRGNHDPKEVYKAKGWANQESISTMLIIKSMEGKKIVLCHYAMRVWPNSHHGDWHLYGHSHNSLKEDNGSLSFDIGVDGWGFVPVSFDVVKKKMETKTFVPVDHHIMEAECIIK